MLGIIVVMMWIIGILAIILMRIIEPDNKIYPVWVIFILVTFSLFCYSRGGDHNDSRRIHKRSKVSPWGGC